MCTSMTIMSLHGDKAVCLCLYHRSDCNLSSNCGQKPQTIRPRSAFLLDPDNKDSPCSLRSRSQSFGYMPRETSKSDKAIESADMSLNTDKHNINQVKESKKHNNWEDKLVNSDQRIDKEECPTRANLPPSDDPSTNSVPYTQCKEKLSDSDKPASTISEDQLGNDTGDKGQNKSKECRGRHGTCKKADFAEMEASSPANEATIQNCSIPKTTDATHKSQSRDDESPGLAQKKKCYQASSDDTPKLPTTNDDANEYTMLGKEHGRATITYVHVRGDMLYHTYTVCIRDTYYVR